MTKEAERLNGLLDTFKGDIKHEVWTAVCGYIVCLCVELGVSHCGSAPALLFAMNAPDLWLNVACSH